ncbi:MAG: MFS transporter [Burkholderiales bacterium]|nr:MFS transporter [Burkholderiales bacterium]
MTGASLSRYNPGLVGWLSVAQLVSWGSTFYLFALLMTPVEQALGLSRAESSLAFSLALLVEGLLAYSVGRWIDQGHERAVMSGGSLLAALSLAALSLVSGRVGFYLAWAGLGAAMAAMLYQPVFAVVTRRYPNDFRRAIITMTFLGGLASTVFIPLIAWLMATWGWRTAVLVLAALHLLVCLPVHWQALRHAPQARRSPAAGQPAATSLTRHLRSPTFALVGLFLVLMMAVTVALPAHMVNLLREHGMSEAWAIAVPASIGVIQVAGRLLMYFFEHHLDVHRANRLILTLLPLALLALLAAPLVNVWQRGLMLLFVLLWGMGNGMLTIVKGTAMALYVSREHVASLNGALGVPQALARAAAPLLLGLLWTPVAGYTSGIWLLLAISLLALGAFTLAQRRAASH